MTAHRRPAHDAYSRACQIDGLLRAAMLAEENETSGVDVKGTPQVLGLALELLAEVIDGIEAMQRAGKAGDGAD